MAQEENGNGAVLGKINYILMAVGFAILIIGYTLLSGGKSPDPKVFSTDLFTTTRVTIAPILIIIGFTIEIIALIIKPKK